MFVPDLKRNAVEFFFREAGQSVQMGQMIKSLLNAMFREGPFDDDMAVRSKAAKEYFWWRTVKGLVTRWWGRSR